MCFVFFFSVEHFCITLSSLSVVDRKKEQIAILEQAVNVYTTELERFLTFIGYMLVFDISHGLNFCSYC